MYLINTDTLELKFYIDSRHCPPYAILSHRWTDDEVAYKDFVKGRRKDSLGYRKIQDFCNVAKRDGLRMAWVDTCCIDKRSSAELQEAINSMFNYYGAAAICYVYLADVDATVADAEFKDQFLKSEWFTRGWTLQELLAPRYLVFYTVDWKLLGQFGASWHPSFTMHSPKQDTALKTLVSQASGIQEKYLPGDYKTWVWNASVACRMSWASQRRTTRWEDMAYSLLGLFNVSMPLLYGEGQATAFLRLQEGIMKSSDDHTLFAWSVHPREHWRARLKQDGLLAPHVRRFRGAQDIIPSQPRQWADTDPYALTSRGVKIVLPLFHWVDEMYLAKLDCYATDGKSGFTIALSKVSGDKQIFNRVFSPVYERWMPDSKDLVSNLFDWKMESILVQQSEEKTRGYLGDVWLLDPGEMSPYKLESITDVAGNERILDPIACGDLACDDGDKEMKDRSQLTASGFDIGESFTKILVRHVDTDEELNVSIEPLARDCDWMGFNTCLTYCDPAPPEREHIGWSVEEWIEQNHEDSDNVHRTPDQPKAFPKMYRLGSRIIVPSLRDKGWCHSVQVCIKSIHSPMKITQDVTHFLDLILSYEALSEGHPAESGHVVIPPDGFTAKVHFRGMDIPTNTVPSKGRQDLTAADIVLG